MNLDGIQPIVDAVLYEGYILYPYRSTSTKNRQRWTFGGIYPRSWSESRGTDPCRMQTQCLLEGSRDSCLHVQLRFLQPVARQVGKLAEPMHAWSPDDPPEFRLVPSLTVDDRILYGWQEGVERRVQVADCPLRMLADGESEVEFAFGPRRDLEPVADERGRFPAVLLRSYSAIRGRVALRAEPVAEGLYRLIVRIENETALEPRSVADREEASLYSFASAHTVLGVEAGAFVSLMDPPDALRDAAADCVNEGTYPVLAGPRGRRDLMLSSPIILYDHPEVAPQSPSDLYDATEIDELLSLTVLAMSDGEKREMAATDARSAALLERIEGMQADDFMRLHGVLRTPPADATAPPEAATLEPASNAPLVARTAGGELRIGDRVLLHPGERADIMDLALDGKTAIVEAIEQDFEDRVYVAVVLDDDPGRAWGLERMPGHRFFFAPEELELTSIGCTPQQPQASGRHL